ncbi:hypothetical protein V496_02129 [Pseudogymnoascus sp. VKM F-4515 (FW-2607)]|nr:hypothetical protein V496_02129 [Pseudogymnoascus sp. VKM F-4515 (FW-2607)]
MPLNGDGNASPPIGQQPFPCKGYHVGLNGAAVAQWNAGQSVTFSLFDSTNTTGATMNKGGAAHSGGSCQVAFSYDEGATWVVVHSWEGNCPRVATPGGVTNVYDSNQDYTFTIPGHFPTGHGVIFAWAWINASGNREYYMSCSPVEIIGVGSGTSITPAGPPLLVANLDPIRGDCYTNDETSVIYPHKYIGDTPVERAPVALGLQSFPSQNSDRCGSDNITLLGLVNGHPKDSNTEESQIATMSTSSSTSLSSNVATNHFSAVPSGQNCY